MEGNTKQFKLITKSLIATVINEAGAREFKTQTPACVSSGNLHN
jgi:hypothetical protein